MKCPYCSSIEDKVIDSRPLEDQSVVRRRRECISCSHRFTTYERLEVAHLMVVKSDNKREPFDKEKVRRGIVRACQKRPVGAEGIEKMVDEIEYELQEYVMEVPSSIIGEKVLKKLHDIDLVAYIRFASVYRQFKDVDSFLQELERLKVETDRDTKNALAQAEAPAQDKKDPQLV